MHWSREELAAAVAAYQQMMAQQNGGQRVIKKRYYEELSGRHGRSVKAWEYRMQNISYVYETMERSFVKGLKPAKNVGSNVLAVIQKLILEHESKIEAPSTSFSEIVNKFTRNKFISVPKGEKNPKSYETKAVARSRCPYVAAWLIVNSNGRCECCGESAPFQRINGGFYLEVHHLKRLADGGSDTVKNAVAVCPNCHRELHHGKNKDTVKKRLYAEIERLERE